MLLCRTRTCTTHRTDKGGSIPRTCPLVSLQLQRSMPPIGRVQSMALAAHREPCFPSCQPRSSNQAGRRAMSWPYPRRKFNLPSGADTAGCSGSGGFFSRAQGMRRAERAQGVDQIDSSLDGKRNGRCPKPGRQVPFPSGAERLLRTLSRWLSTSRRARANHRYLLCRTEGKDRSLDTAVIEHAYQDTNGWVQAVEAESYRACCCMSE